jgi:DNA replication and repair protein RecF
MLLEFLVLKNFRNHRHLEMKFDPKVNFIIGDNGVGKTNILEAIQLLSTGRSFRTSHLTDLIHHEHSSFYLEAYFRREGVPQTLKIGYDGTKKHIVHNTSSLPAFSHLLGVIPSVLYSPKDIALIIGSPTERRRFLNLYLGQSDPLYVHHLIRYTKALEHRNTLLKAKSVQQSGEIECFEHEMARSSSYLMKERQKALDVLQARIAPIIQKLTQVEERFVLLYKPSCLFDQSSSLEQCIAEQYQKQRNKEFLLGTSLIGPHRDDFLISLQQHPIKAFCSEGQQRSFLSALKIAEWQLLKEKNQQTPLMCIDDLGIHLDAKRKTLLESQIQYLGQVLITSPKKPHWESSAQQHKVFDMHSTSHYSLSSCSK